MCVILTWAQAALLGILCGPGAGGVFESGTPLTDDLRERAAPGRDLPLLSVEEAKELQKKCESNPSWTDTLFAFLGVGFGPRAQVVVDPVICPQHGKFAAAAVQVNTDEKLPNKRVSEERRNSSSPGHHVIRTTVTQKGAKKMRENKRSSLGLVYGAFVSLLDSLDKVFMPFADNNRLTTSTLYSVSSAPPGVAYTTTAYQMGTHVDSGDRWSQVLVNASSGLGVEMEIEFTVSMLFFDANGRAVPFGASKVAKENYGAWINRPIATWRVKFKASYLMTATGAGMIPLFLIDFGDGTKAAVFITHAVLDPDCPRVVFISRLRLKHDEKDKAHVLQAKAIDELRKSSWKASEEVLADYVGRKTPAVTKALTTVVKQCKGDVGGRRLGSAKASWKDRCASCLPCRRAGRTCQAGWSLLLRPGETLDPETGEVVKRTTSFNAADDAVDASLLLADDGDEVVKTTPILCSRHAKELFKGGSSVVHAHRPCQQQLADERPCSRAAVWGPTGGAAVVCTKCRQAATGDKYKDYVDVVAGMCSECKVNPAMTGPAFEDMCWGCASENLSADKWAEILKSNRERSRTSQHRKRMRIDDPASVRRDAVMNCIENFLDDQDRKVFPQPPRRFDRNFGFPSVEATRDKLFVYYWNTSFGACDRVPMNLSLSNYHFDAAAAASLPGAKAFVAAALGVINDSVHPLQTAPP